MTSSHASHASHHGWAVGPSCHLQAAQLALLVAQVRVGVSIHHSVQSVALDTLVEHRLGGDAGGQVKHTASCTLSQHSIL